MSLFVHQRLYCPAPIRTLSEGYVETMTASPEMSTWSQMGRWSGTWTHSEKAGGSVTGRPTVWRSPTFLTQSMPIGRTTTRVTLNMVPWHFGTSSKWVLIRNKVLLFPETFVPFLQNSSGCDLQNFSHMITSDHSSQSDHDLYLYLLIN